MNPSVFVGIPSGSTWHADFAMSLIQLVAASGKPLKSGNHIERLQIWNTRGSILSRSRTTLVTTAIEQGFSHILMVDSDMTFPAWTLHQLLSHKQRVVAANCVTKSHPANPTARMLDGTSAGEPLINHKCKPLTRVWRVGTGIMLIDLAVFSEIKAPWFPIAWNQLTCDYIGEDWGFCEALDAAHIPIYVDRKVSDSVGHVGDYTFTVDDTVDNIGANFPK